MSKLQIQGLHLFLSKLKVPLIILNINSTANSGFTSIQDQVRVADLRTSTSLKNDPGDDRVNVGRVFEGTGPILADI